MYYFHYMYMANIYHLWLHQIKTCTIANKFTYFVLETRGFSMIWSTEPSHNYAFCLYDWTHTKDFLKCNTSTVHLVAIYRGQEIWRAVTDTKNTEIKKKTKKVTVLLEEARHLLDGRLVASPPISCQPFLDGVVSNRYSLK